MKTCVVCNPGNDLLDYGPFRIRLSRLYVDFRPFDQTDDYDCLIFGATYSQQVYDQMLLAKQRRQRVILDVCEALPIAIQLAAMADIVVVCSHKLLELIPKGIVIEDAVEEWMPNHDQGDNLIGWIGYGGNAYLAEKYRNLNLRTIHEQPNADIKWERDSWAYNLSQCRFGLLTANPQQPYKSANKLTTYLALGLTPIWTPEAAQHDAYLRVKDVNDYHIDRICEKWAKIL